MEYDLPELLVIACIAALSPMVSRVSKKVLLPLVVIEIVLGMVVGPHMLNLVNVDASIGFMGSLGLAFLFFLAGAELDVRTIAGPPLKRATISWIAMFAVALGVCFALSINGFVHAPFLIAIALSTTAMGILIPVLRDRGILRTGLGVEVLATASIGEFGPVLLLSVVASQHAAMSTQLLLMLLFVSLALIALFLAARTQPSRVEQILSTTLHVNAQFAVRVSVLLLVALVVLAGSFGLDVVLGAFTAGMIVGILTRGEKGSELRERIETVGFGFFIPLFFVSSGVKYDFTALFASADTIMRLPIFLGIMLALRFVVVLPFYRKTLGPSERMQFALLVSTGLPIIVAITEIGVTTGRMRTDNAAALIGAGMLSVLIFPAVASLFKRTSNAGTSNAGTSNAAVSNAGTSNAGVSNAT